jgi:6-phosphofructokinase 1
VAAVEAVHDGAFGSMVGLHAGDIVRVPLAGAVNTLKTVDPTLLEIADLFSA